jgi:hypothetical protein
LIVLNEKSSTTKSTKNLKRKKETRAFHFLANSFENVGLRPLAPQRGEKDRERGTRRMNLPSKREPPLPNPLLHKCVEERERDKAARKRDARRRGLPGFSSFVLLVVKKSEWALPP